MYQSKTISLKSTSNVIINSNLKDLFRYFKYELLKVLIFLMLFAASVIYTNAESKAYYSNNSESVQEK